jgi:hypothetical protein
MAQFPVATVWPQVPSPLQTSAVQASPSSQLYAFPPQVPAVQTSLAVHAFPSLQTVPSVLFGSEHVPVDGLHVPTLWHWSFA